MPASLNPPKGQLPVAAGKGSYEGAVITLDLDDRVLSLEPAFFLRVVSLLKPSAHPDTEGGGEKPTTNKQTANKNSAG